MFVHEYQAKVLLSQRGFSFPPGKIAQSAEQAVSAAESLDADFWVVKAQVLAGDRARFGGVKIARSLPEVGVLTRELLGTNLVTTQTGAAGLPVRHIYVESGCRIRKEFYLACVVDRQASSLTLLASIAGGTNVEDQAPEQILRLPLSVDAPLNPEAVADVARQLQLEGSQAEEFTQICTKLHQAVIDFDATAIELNPLALTNDGDLIGLDVKMELDDNASFRRTEVAVEFEEGEDPNRVLRADVGYNYVRLNGDIGLLVSGAGLALATIDLVKLHGGEPANFLDLPPVATSTDVSDACLRIFQLPSLKALFVNIVGGGLTHCDTVAEGMIAAHRKSPIQCPVIVRFAGTSKDHAAVLLRNAGLPFTQASDMRNAVEQLIRIAGH